MSKSLAISYSMKKKKKSSGGTVKSGDAEMDLSKGGSVAMKEEHRLKGVNQTAMGYDDDPGTSSAGHSVRMAKDQPKHKKSFMYEAKAKAQRSLEQLRSMKGPKGNYAEGGEVNPTQEVTCPNCSKSFSHGGQVANDTDMSADMMPNEFDDLVLRDDEELDTPDDDDMVGRAMAKRKAKKK